MIKNNMTDMVREWYFQSIFFRFSKEIKNAPECIVELYKHAGIFKNTREVHKPSASRTSRVFLKIPKCLYKQQRMRRKFFISFMKC